jgi:hypothetical protein
VLISGLFAELVNSLAYLYARQPKFAAGATVQRHKASYHYLCAFPLRASLIVYNLLKTKAGMAELADAVDSKSIKACCYASAVVDIFEAIQQPPHQHG